MLLVLTSLLAISQAKTLTFGGAFEFQIKLAGAKAVKTREIERGGGLKELCKMSLQGKALRMSMIELFHL